jgi:hypothetical protein
MLGAWPADRVTAWGDRTPAELTQSFLRRLLNRSGSDEGPREESLVVAVPATGAQAAPRTRPRDSGAELAEILRALGHPPQRVLPAPIAALAYLRRERPGLTEARRFAVCDIGAGGMSFSLCAATESGARVTDVVRMTGATAWNDDTAPASVRGGRPVTLAERLVAEIARNGSAPAAVPGDGRSVHRWRALEATLATGEEEGTPGYGLQRVFAGGGRHPGFGMLRFADVNVTVGQLLAACAPLADSAEAALSGLLSRQADAGWRHFGTGPAARIVLIGGLTALAPVRAALLRAAGLDPRDPGGAVVEADPADRLGTAALGAALVAAGKADPSTPYPYGLHLPVYRAVRGGIESSYLELAAAATIAPDQGEAPVTAANGAPLVVTVRAGGGPAPLPVQLVRPDGTPAMPASFQPAQAPPAGDYRISVSGDPAGAAIVLRSVKDDRALRFVLRQPDGPADGNGVS